MKKLFTVLITNLMASFLLRCLCKSSSSTSILLSLVLLLALVLVVQLRHVLGPCPVFVVDFSCLRPPSNCRAPASSFIEHAVLFNVYNQESISFMSKVLSTYGQSDQTYLPQPLHFLPPRNSYGDAIQEAQMLLFATMDDLFAKTKLPPSHVDVLIVTSSAFNPSPSMSSIIVNKFNLREDVKTYNLSGMGCSSGGLAVDMARNILQSSSVSFAVVVSTEVLSSSWYSGNDIRKLVLNCGFRMGASAVLLTNKRTAKSTAKYELLHVLRNQVASNDNAYYSAFLEEDSQGKRGFSVDPSVMQHFSDLLRTNFTALGKSILPISEKAKHMLSMVVKKVYNPKHELYVPRFDKVINHFCIPPTSLSLVKEVGRRLKLREEHIEPAKMTIRRFGNQSSAGMWYEMAYMEAKCRIKKGDKLWQIWAGSGLKCCSIILESLRTWEQEDSIGPWNDCICEYPIY